jgi:L-fuconolactonase
MHTHIWDLPSERYPWHAPVKPLSYGRARRETPGQSPEEFRLLTPSFAQTTAPAEMLLQFMDWLEVERAAILPSFVHGFDNRYIADCARRWPDRFIGFGRVDLMSDELIAQATRAVEDMSLCGLYAGPTDGQTGVWFDDEKLAPFWCKVSGWGTPVTLHISTLRRKADLAGWPHHPYQAYLHQIPHLARVAQRHPKAHILIDHLGDPVTDEDPPYPTFQELLSLAGYPNFYLKVSESGYFSQQEYPYADVQPFIHMAVEAFGPQRVLWGSGFPGALLRCTYAQAINVVRQACDFLSTEDKALILGGAAAMLMNIA